MVDENGFEHSESDPENLILIPEPDGDPSGSTRTPTPGFNKLDAIVTSENSTKFVPKNFQAKKIFKNRKYSNILSIIFIR